MKITRQVVALLIAGTGATVLSAGCGSDSPGKTVPHLTCQEPGTSECVDATSGVVCAEGETEGVEFVCEAGETCVDGACVGQCEGGTSECLGTLAVRICTDDGREWVPVACQPGTTCVDGACAPSETDDRVCTPGATECVDEGTQRRCNDDGTEWEEVECPDTAPCSEGACRGEVCTVGDVRCDESVEDPMTLLLMFEGSGPPPDFGVTYRCVDGTRWEQEPCSLGEVCTYSGVSPSEVDRYRQEFSTLIFNGVEGTPLPSRPSLDGLKASCQPNECLQMLSVPKEEITQEQVNAMTFFEGTVLPSVSSRTCGTVGVEDPDVEELHARFTQCVGTAPYSRMRLNEVECSSGRMCVPNNPAYGCVVPTCYPGEEQCGDGIEACDPWTLDWSTSGETCADRLEEDSASCSTQGEAPERSVECSPVILEK